MYIVTDWWKFKDKSHTFTVKLWLNKLFWSDAISQERPMFITTKKLSLISDDLLHKNKESICTYQHLNCIIPEMSKVISIMKVWRQNYTIKTVPKMLTDEPKKRTKLGFISLLVGLQFLPFQRQFLNTPYFLPHFI